MKLRNSQTLFSIFKLTKHFAGNMKAETHSRCCVKTLIVEGRNVEIKARVGSFEEFNRRVEIAKILTKSSGIIIEQRDVFFNSQSGRLKLRYLQPPSFCQLVNYVRPDMAGPKLTTFIKIELNEPQLMEKILTQTNGMLGVLIKKRYFFLYERTRIHLDKVKDLGNFMEFEVCLSPDQTFEDGQAVVNHLSKKFDIKDEDLMTGSYFEMFQKCNLF